MAYNQALAEKIRRVVATQKGMSEKAMFGGIAFLEKGKMVVGVQGDSLMARIGPEAYEDVLQTPHVKPMIFTGKPMRGFIYVSQKGWSNDSTLKKWVSMSREYVATLPLKKKK